ncbi:9955_t:CDS:1, partial [Ambispora gerdemannii]
VATFMEKRKNEKGIIRLEKYQKCIEILKNPNIKADDAKLKFWTKERFVLIKVDGLHVLNLKSEDRQVIPFED